MHAFAHVRLNVAALSTGCHQTLEYGLWHANALRLGSPDAAIVLKVLYTTSALEG